MPNRDGTGPQGQGSLTGGGRGFCVGAPPFPGRGAGRGRRNQFYATGLTGWQRAAQAEAQAAGLSDGAADPFVRLDEKLTEVLVRLERLESAGQD
jgi:hypothetical protein